MSFGVVMMAHTALHRAAQVARLWCNNGCPVVIHVDKKVPQAEYEKFVATLSGLDDVHFCKRHRCEWGGWGLVAAAQSGASDLLERYPDIEHVYLSSGTCLPLRPISDLAAYLTNRPGIDFIESATTEDVPWTVGGLDEERFTLRFPFSWKKQRRLFDKYVEFQRKIGFKRDIPDGLVPHMGSQWWCLSRQTISAILNDPKRKKYDRYFSKVWIPDESYFQTLARLHSSGIESRSLTLSMFDFQGKPHIFYDDHLELLRRSDCFVARKIWPKADILYDTFLNVDQKLTNQEEPKPSKIERLFAKAVTRRTRGREGLVMQSRFPNPGWENGLTSAEYSVFEGFIDLFEDFDQWLSLNTGCSVHGHIFDLNGAQFEQDNALVVGCLSRNASLRDYNPEAFLRNFIWTTRGERQCFQFGPRDNQRIGSTLAADANAHISVISGAWALKLFQSDLDFPNLRKEAARLQRIENEHLKILRSPNTAARVNIWSMAEFVESPLEPCQQIVNEIGPRALRRITVMPKMVDLSGFGAFIQKLKNEGMHPYLVGDFSVNESPAQSNNRQAIQKPYLVR